LWRIPPVGQDARTPKEAKLVIAQVAALVTVVYVSMILAVVFVALWAARSD
jgi:hypothetical protein